MPPTVFADVKDEMRIAQEEIFGPVISAIPFTDIDEVIQRGNATTFGLGSGVWTRDVSKAHQLAKAIRAGSVWVNCYQAMDPAVPFGGYKMSGYGRESRACSTSRSTSTSRRSGSRLDRHMTTRPASVPSLTSGCAGGDRHTILKVGQDRYPAWTGRYVQLNMSVHLPGGWYVEETEFVRPGGCPVVRAGHCPSAEQRGDLRRGQPEERAG